MSKLDINELVHTMIKEAESVLKDPKLRNDLDDAKKSFIAIGRSIAEIEVGILDGTFTEQSARKLIKMHKNSAKVALLTIKGLGRITAEKMINAALDSVRNTVNTALGWALL